MASSPTQKLHAAVPAPRWNLPLRIAFRFSFAYFTLFCLAQGIIPAALPTRFQIPALALLWPLRQITFWTAAHIFGVKGSIGYVGGSDTLFGWITTFCLLLIAVVITAVWSVLDRRRESYVTLHKWLRLFIRFALASVLFGYGFFKVIPLQMTFPSLVRLVEPFGHLSHGALLFWSIGAARPYEIFTGLAEVLGGILLIVPRTTTLGALVSFAATLEVFVLNMAYNFIVKLFSLHLVLFSLFLLAPELKRMYSFFFLNRETGPSTQPPLFRSSRANRIALAVQVLFGLFLVGINLQEDVKLWYGLGGGRPRPSLFGIWDVEQMSVDGQVRPPLLTDNNRWRRVLFDYTTSTSFQRMDDSFASFGSSINDNDKTITLKKAGDQNWKSTFSFERPAQDQLTLDGAMDGHQVHMQLKLFDRNSLPMVSDKFHWISYL
jgi:uncharacterized membrane protein YphA (DoxX/SURF4 family)